MQGIRFTDAGALAACQMLSEGVKGDALWAATWVYASTGNDPAPLLTLTGNDDATIRLMAGAGLTGRGRLEGLDALIGSIASDAGVRGAVPPVTVANFAIFTLSRYTAAMPVQAAGTAEEKSAAAAAWGSWLTENRARLVYDPQQQLWVVR